MRRREHLCVGCGIPCLGPSCEFFYPIEYVACDECGCELDTVYRDGPEELCRTHLLERYYREGEDSENKICSECGAPIVGDIYEKDGFIYCEDCLLEIHQDEY